ncbi:MAG: beta-galactosidase [Bacteroidales bacterium]|nr:beta-galactosidase [Bacteroidales bacterium]
MKLERIQSVFLLLILLYSCNPSNNIPPVIEVEGVENPVISLNGAWKFSMNAPENFSNLGFDYRNWHDIQVPGECQMQGFAIKHDVPCVYKRAFDVPEDFEGKQILINFYGVYSYARVWVNGKFVREHFGGFTKWSCDITSLVEAGEKAELTVEVTDRVDDISYGSGYAKHQIGGILRNVELAALPAQHFKEIYFETDLDEDYTDAKLHIHYSLNKATQAKLKFELFDRNKRLVGRYEKENADQSGQVSLTIENPLKWDAEHPNLYTVLSTIKEKGQLVMRKSEKIGFREVEVSGNKLLVNGKEIKLRGACRHDIHPTLGRMTTPEYARMDVLLAKEANMNFIRTSHYPPSEAFLKYCDQFGIYVEDETAVCFVHSWRSEDFRKSATTQDDTLFTGRYLSQLAEMVDNHRNSPSVIIWSIGNENTFGTNFLKSYNWVKSTDLTRPVIYSYPGQVPDSLKVYDILSMHYPQWNGTLEQYGKVLKGFSYASMPALNDEWAHVSCYNKNTLQVDPNVRNFWGQSLDSMWTNVFEADGGLGGAIWGMIDETFMMPDTLSGFNEWWGKYDVRISPPPFIGHCIGYGEWGIVDTWRRKKPEFRETKKAYSPTKILVKQIDDFQPDQPLKLSVHNRFDHTNFNELKILWKYKEKSGRIAGFNLEPHKKGELVVPAMSWTSGEKLKVQFFQNDTSLIDEYNIRIGEREITLPECQKGKLVIHDSGDLINVRGKKFSMQVNKKSGLLEDINMNNQTVIKSGPYLNLSLWDTRKISGYAKNWKCTGFKYELEDGIAKIHTKGLYDNIEVDFVLLADENGVFNIDFDINGLPEGSKVQELGIKFIMGSSFEKLAWDRDAYFTAYPGDDLGAPVGEVDLNYRPAMKYRTYPDHNWVFDTKGFYYFGLDTVLPLSNIARSMKENIYAYSLKTGPGETLTVYSDGNQACRFNKVKNDFLLHIDDQWDYPDLAWGNYMKNIILEKSFHGRATLVVQPGKK